MSGPHPTSSPDAERPSDPDRVDPDRVDPDPIEDAVTEALAAFAAAATLAELKQARLAHAGDRSPVALANRAIGTLPPAERKGAGSRVGQARGQIAAALKAREAELAEAELARTLAERTRSRRLRIDARRAADALADHRFRRAGSIHDVLAGLAANPPSRRYPGTTTAPPDTTARS